MTPSPNPGGPVPNAAATAAPAPEISVEAATNAVKSLVPAGQKLVGTLADQAKTQVKSQINERKNDLATTILALARSLHEGATSGDASAVAGPVDALAARAMEFANSLSAKDVEQIAADTEAFARTRPALFLAGAAVAGLLVGRFLKSSNHGATTA